VLCEHLRPLEEALLDSGVKVTSRGQAWSENCREWVYFDVVLDLALIQQRYQLSPCVTPHENTDPRSGAERGLECTTCHDAVMGLVKGRRKWPGRRRARAGA
jgi:hypothetical protein